MSHYSSNGTVQFLKGSCAFPLVPVCVANAQPEAQGRSWLPSEKTRRVPLPMPSSRPRSLQQTTDESFGSNDSIELGLSRAHYYLADEKRCFRISSSMFPSSRPAQLPNQLKVDKWLSNENPTPDTWARLPQLHRLTKNAWHQPSICWSDH